MGNMTDLATRHESAGPIVTIKPDGGNPHFFDEHSTDSCARVPGWWPSVFSSESTSGPSLDRVDETFNRWFAHAVRAIVVAPSSIDFGHGTWPIAASSHPETDLLAHLDDPIHGAPIETTADAAKDLKSWLALSVRDVARMVGVKRRQYYNLMNGDKPNSGTARRLIEVREALRPLYEASGDDPEVLRNVILTPIRGLGTSLFQAAVDDDRLSLRAASDQMLGRVVRGVTFGDRPVPPPIETPNERDRAREVIEDTPPAES